MVIFQFLKIKKCWVKKIIDSESEELVISCRNYPQNLRYHYLVHLIQTTNTNLEFLQRILFSYFVMLVNIGKRKVFKLRAEFIKKCQYNSLHTKK